MQALDTQKYTERISMVPYMQCIHYDIILLKHIGTNKEKKESEFSDPEKPLKKLVAERIHDDGKYSILNASITYMF